MSTPFDGIVLLGVKRTVIAFDQQSGQRLWTHELASGLSGDFITVLADQTRVYAHTHGEIFCLDLRTGAVLWKDALTGLGYGIASIALPGSGVASSPAMAAREKDDQAQAAASSSAATSSG